MVLFAAIGGFGYGMYGSVDQALNVDVLPNAEEAGKDLGILNMATTLGQMVGPIVTSVIVTVTGSYSFVFPFAIALVVVACYFILRIRSVK
jgi:MFS family permease